MSGLFGQPKPQRAEKVKPEPPIALPEKGETEVTRQKLRSAAGRGGTILAGELTPETRKKNILGGRR